MFTHQATLSPKGQLTVPADIRERLALKPGDKVEFRILRDGTITFHAMNVTVDDLFGMIAYKGSPKTIDQINEAIADAAVDGSGILRSGGVAAV
jgi:antitoxin PrlF